MTLTHEAGREWGEEQIHCVYFLKALQQTKGPEEASSDSNELHPETSVLRCLSHQPQHFPVETAPAAEMPRELPGERRGWNVIFFGKSGPARALRNEEQGKEEEGAGRLAWQSEQ